MKQAFLIIALIITSEAWAQNKVNILVSLSPAGSFSAVSGKVKGKLSKENGSFVAKKIQLAINSLKTGIDLRDEHFWEHLNAKTHSKAILTNLVAKDGKASATLEVNGEKKPIIIRYTETGKNINAKFSVRASDFKLPPKSYLGVGVKDEVEVEVTLGYKNKK
ncbi:MAG: YceI family protein [Bacteriovoracaceae bacterium]|nr:YceI family protein [Bacteriovoracaceae bacterium]